MRLIDADALANRMQFLIRTHHRDVFDALNEIDNAPTIDPESLRPQGEWIVFLSDYDDCEMMRCSCCDSEFYDGDNDTVDNFPNYCPNCGAKMKGG